MQVDPLIGSLNNNDGDGYENVISKVRSRCFKLYCAYSVSFSSSNLGNFFCSWILRLYQSSEKEEESRCLVFTSFTKREIRHFHVVVVQWRQRNVQKNVTHAQSCCFAILSAFMSFSLTSPSSLLKFPDKGLTNLRVNHESIHHMTSWPHLSTSCQKTSNKNPTHRACILYIYRTSMVHLDRMPTI